MARAIKETSFKTVLSKVRQLPIHEIAWPVVSLDPGDTTGWSVFQDGELKSAGQIPGTAQEIENLLESWEPAVVVAEEYRVYGWKAKQHSWSDVPTLQLIGAMKYICEKLGIPYFMQSAQQAKGFATNDKLQGWGLWQASSRHANDAIRHAVYYLLCSKVNLGRRE